MNANLYLTSANPFHWSHWNTFMQAQKMLSGPVTIGITQNGLKSSGLFSLEERRKIIVEIYKVPNSQVITLENKDQIVLAITSAQKIIRGIRTSADIKEINRLVDFYGVSDQYPKLFRVNVPKDFKKISSSKLINMIEGNTYNISYNWVPLEVINLIKEKLEFKNSQL